MMKKTAHIALVSLFLSTLLISSGCTPQPRTWGRSMMGTEVAITIHDGPGRLTGNRWKAAADSAFAEMHRVEVMAWSGELAALNDSSAAGAPDSISDELYGLIDHAFEVSEITDVDISKIDPVPMNVSLEVVRRPPHGVWTLPGPGPKRRGGIEGSPHDHKLRLLGVGVGVRKIGYVEHSG